MTPIDSRTDWTTKLLEEAWKEIEIIAEEELELKPGVDLYTNQFEIVSAEQMLDAYSSIGLPINYNHWSFGKEFLKNEKQYQKGQMGLAYEMVINSNPCINLLMEENLAFTQIMVMAHAGIGHNAVFANNAYFKQWTQASSVIDYMIFARDYIRSCEEQYGQREVEMVLDAAHAISTHAVDKFKRKHRAKLSEEGRLKSLATKDNVRQQELDVILQKTTVADPSANEPETMVDEEEENILYYIMKKSPNMEEWKREVCRIVYKINQYFSPQAPTKTLNEGFATFCHYHIMEKLEQKGFIKPDAYLAYLALHSGVVYQPAYNSKHYSGANPYALGFAIFRDLKRMCELPTEEDRVWFPNIAGRRWQDVIKEAAFDHRDDSFIQQYLSPKVMRDLKLFTVSADYAEDESFGHTTVAAWVKDIHDEEGYAAIRTTLAQSKERINYIPHIFVQGADLEGDRTLHLKYVSYKERALAEEDAAQVVAHLDFLWGYKVELHLE